MKKAVYLFVALLTSLPAWSAGPFEREVVISEAQIQAALVKAGPLQQNYGGFVTVSLKDTPIISLDSEDGRAMISARMDVVLLGNSPIPVDVLAKAGLRYDDRSKAFFLTSPVVDAVESPVLSRDAQPAARQAATQLIASYFRAKPVYVLRQDGSPEEQAARWLLKSVRIEPGRLVAILSPI